jgi:hypothetical protein
MSTTNRDASNTTARRGQIALWTFRQNNVTNGVPIYPEQSAMSMNQGPTASVPAQVYVGAQLIGQTNNGQCGCTSDFTYQGYDKKSPASC